MLGQKYLLVILGQNMSLHVAANFPVLSWNEKSPVYSTQLKVPRKDR